MIFCLVSLISIKPRSNGACDPAATLPRLKNDNRREVAEVAARFYKGRYKVAARSAIGCRTKSVTASILSMHKRLAATDFNRQLVAKVF